jgi:hypothetical protein
MTIFESSLGQAPNLASAGDFAVFTSAGAFNNTGTTFITGDIGTDEGAFSFAPGVVVGETHVADGVSSQAATDLAAAYASLSATSCDQVLDVTLGNGQIVTPNVYCIGAASTLNGTLILDGQGDPNAVFIFKIDGAFATSTFSNVVLINSATFDNVYWQVTGRFDLGASSVFRGTVVGGGAIDLGEGASVVGRALTTAGAIDLHNNNVVSSEGALPVTLVSFDAKNGEGQTVNLKWGTTAETNSDRFEIEHSVNGKNWNKLATIRAKGESNSLVNYDYTDEYPWKGVNMYRLKMIDTDETFAYSRIRSVKINRDENLTLYPNPTVDKLTLVVDDISQVQRIQLNDITGKVVFSREKNASASLSSEIDLKNLASGYYVVKITRQEGPTAFMRILKQ